MEPSALLGKRRQKRDKAERMASTMEGESSHTGCVLTVLCTCNSGQTCSRCVFPLCTGRVGREFGSKASMKAAKTGGMSNREKERKKRLPIAARGAQVRKRMDRTKQKSRAKNFRGHVRQK